LEWPEDRLGGALAFISFGVTVLAALREHALRYRVGSGANDANFAAFVELVESTPALREYAQRMWLRH
jgi:hypothetical protein